MSLSLSLSLSLSFLGCFSLWGGAASSSSPLGGATFLGPLGASLAASLSASLAASLAASLSASLAASLAAAFFLGCLSFFF